MNSASGSSTITIGAKRSGSFNGPCAGSDSCARSLGLPADADVLRFNGIAIRQAPELLPVGAGEILVVGRGRQQASGDQQCRDHPSQRLYIRG